MPADGGTNKQTPIIQAHLTEVDNLAAAQLANDLKEDLEWHKREVILRQVRVSQVAKCWDKTSARMETNMLVGSSAERAV